MSIPTRFVFNPILKDDLAPSLEPPAALPAACLRLWAPVSISWDAFNHSHNAHGCDLGPKGTNTGSGQAHSLWRCWEQIEKYEGAAAPEYPWVLRLRPDVLYGFELPPLRAAASEGARTHNQ